MKTKTLIVPYKGADLKLLADLGNIRVTNFIASTINSAFETGIAPQNYTVESLNKDGFLDAAFAESDLPTPSGKPAKVDWSLRVMLEDCPWVTLTPDKALKNIVKKMVKDSGSGDVNGDFSTQKCHDFLLCINYLSSKPFNEDQFDDLLMNTYEPDGVHDDMIAQASIAGEVIFG